MVALVRVRLGGVMAKLAPGTRFVGVDVSTKFTGIIVLSLTPAGQTKFEHSTLLEMPPASPSNKGEILHLRFASLVDGFSKLYNDNDDGQLAWRVTVEDKILMQMKGVVGSHSLAECIACARIAAEQVFRTRPNTVSPLTARAGLGLNNMKTGGNRSATKLLVVNFAQQRLPPQAFAGVAKGGGGVEDVADAYVLALSAVKQALCRELCLDEEILKKFKSCHQASLERACTAKELAAGTKVNDEVRAQLEQRMPKWLDQVFPKDGDA
ncbi:hypothetical protein BASA81_004054 [Batrachochytrium salamandrivorans]|nr:hypothetical protein BASA81_004054 [Batrachochytrium salamandrivorans]